MFSSHLLVSFFFAMLLAALGILALCCGFNCLRQRKRVIQLGVLRFPVEVVVIVCFIAGPLLILFTYIFSRAWFL